MIHSGLGDIVFICVHADKGAAAGMGYRVAVAHPTDMYVYMIVCKWLILLFWDSGLAPNNKAALRPLVLLGLLQCCSTSA